MSESNYKQLAKRKNLKKLNTGGNGRTAWVAFNSLPERFKDKITSQCDPYERTKHILFEDYITPDHYAENFCHVLKTVYSYFVSLIYVFHFLS